MHEYFHETRNSDVHEGFGFVTGVQIEMNFSGADRTVRESWLLAHHPGHSPGTPAEECREYFAGILQVALDGYSRFRDQWDPDSRLAASFEALRNELKPVQ